MKSRGFTMIEVLVAVTLVGLLLVALNTFVFSMGELWGKNSDLRVFDQHVRNVTRFMQQELERAALPPAGKYGQAAISIQDVKPQNRSTEPMLTFLLPQGSRLIAWPGHALPDVLCSLMVRDREGLLLLWHSRLEKDFGETPPRETVISPLVSAMSYDYYDADFKRWRTEASLQRGSNGEMMTPQRLRLKFTYDRLSRETLVALPATPEGLPHF